MNISCNKNNNAKEYINIICRFIYHLECLFLEFIEFWWWNLNFWLSSFYKKKHLSLYFLKIKYLIKNQLFCDFTEVQSCNFSMISVKVMNWFGIKMTRHIFKNFSLTDQIYNQWLSKQLQFWQLHELISSCDFFC